MLRDVIGDYFQMDCNSPLTVYISLTVVQVTLKWLRFLCLCILVDVY